MKKIVLSGLIVSLPLAALLALPARQEPNFIKDLTDFPLIEDMTIHEEKYVFTSPSGTVARFILAGGQAAHHYHGLYAKSLPALGWQCASRLLTNSSKKSFHTVPKAKVLACIKDGESLTMTPVSTPDGNSAGALFELDYKPLRKTS